MRRRLLTLFAGVVLLAGGERMFAHHSFSATYDSSQKVEIEGVVKEFVWRNPHSFLRIDVTDKDGVTKTWALEWGSITQLSQSQMTRTSLGPAISSSSAANRRAIRHRSGCCSRASSGRATDGPGRAGSSSDDAATLPHQECLRAGARAVGWPGRARRRACTGTRARRRCGACGVRARSGPCRLHGVLGLGRDGILAPAHAVPPKGEFAMLPLNAEARRVADGWDPAKDKADISAGAMARRHHARPGASPCPLGRRQHAAGRYRRRHADPCVPVWCRPGRPRLRPLQWQGYSVATWEGAGARGRGAVARVRPDESHDHPHAPRVPAQERRALQWTATLEEYFDRFSEPNGDTWLLVTPIVTDPQYLTQPYVTTMHFKKIPDRSGWDPTPCRVKEPR